MECRVGWVATHSSINAGVSVQIRGVPAPHGRPPRRIVPTRACCSLGLLIGGRKEWVARAIRLSRMTGDEVERRDGEKAFPVREHGGEEYTEMGAVTAESTYQSTTQSQKSATQC